ncbi:hypothetical protein JZ751_020765 [Albula glossodonta]|uniref:Little elongation complex subunit 2 C-terminal domain-containing protein n=1 Tax=Albula glossodonta TaxID=121402 RepID=A0A8T2PN29_9TELE|nr:hypothetical protein JZ751_020765 [Albula glossodonta]
MLAEHRSGSCMSCEDHKHWYYGVGMECLRASLEKVKNHPQVYLIHEMTSITGGKFNPDLSLNFEKQLLAMGKVMMVELHKGLPKNVQLMEDYIPVSSETPPAKKASLTYMDVSCDQNAEKLFAKYEPHVCLTSQAFSRLLNNQGPEYSEQWEIPVWVKMEKGTRKEVYIDSPLVKTEMTVRERNQVFHEESVKLILKKSGTKAAAELVLDLSTSDCMESQRSVIAFAEENIDFEADFTDLETFGESSSQSKKSKTQTETTLSGSGVKPTFAHPKAVAKTPNSISDMAIEVSRKDKSAMLVKEVDSSWTDVEDSSKLDCSSIEESEETDLSLQCTPPNKKLKLDLSVEHGDGVSFDDSDEERLVIDAPVSPKRSSAVCMTDSPKAKKLALLSESSIGSPMPPSSEIIADTPASPTPDCHTSSSPELNKQRQLIPASSTIRQQAGRPRRGGHTEPQDCDQLGQILRMQDALLKPSHNPFQEVLSSPPRGTNLCGPSTPSQSHPQSLVKPCVSSYLVANQGPDQGASIGAALTVTAPDDNQTTAQSKRLLSEGLLASSEEELNYECPEEGNLVYSLYSLQDVLMLVRSSVPLARGCKLGNEIKPVPVHFLPKLEYQLCYGLECLTKSEACQLWAERQLHSSTMSYIGHIDALTSKLFLTEGVTPSKIGNASCGFVLQEGRYLLCHKPGEPFITILKASKGKKMTRATYDLHEAHSDLPKTPTHGPVPWLPVDPSTALSFHNKHSRIPCTFPPQMGCQVSRPKGKSPSTRGGHPVGASKPQPAKKKRKTKAQRRKRQKQRKEKSETN